MLHWIFCFLVLSIAVLVLLLVLDCVIRLASNTSFKGVQDVEDGNESSTPAADCETRGLQLDRHRGRRYSSVLLDFSSPSHSAGEPKC